MKIAILGTRGVPPAYGGFETFAAELGTRLVSRGHHVTVYCRNGDDESWNGIRRVSLPAINHKYFETVSHTFLSAIDAVSSHYDVILLCNAANAFTIPILRAARLPVAINVDGIERRRRKWNVLGRTVYAIGETFSASFANRVVADAEVIARYYRRHYHVQPAMIPYGADFPNEGDSDVLERLGVEKRNYILYVSRFEPENNPLEVVKAYEATPSTVNRQPSTPLVMLGTGLYAPELVQELLNHQSPHILFPGALYGADYRTLQRNALFYIQATEVGGTHPALIEAMGSGGAVLALDTPENREVGGGAIGYFRFQPRQTLSERIEEWLLHPEERERLRELARKRVVERYSWESVTDRYEQLFREILGSA